MEVKARRRVALEPDVVWQVLSDHVGMSEWSPGVSVTLDREGDADRDGVGAIRRVTGFGMTIREEVLAAQPGELLVYRAVSGMPLRGYRGRVRIAPRITRAGSTVEWVLSADSTSPVARLVLVALTRSFLSGLLRAAARSARTEMEGSR